MTVSVYIPTDSDRLSKLDDIIQIYNSGTIIPDEIIISAFYVMTDEHLSYLKDIHSKQYSNVKIYAGKNLGTIAENQNYSFKFATSDIIAYHDPLKLPSIMRIEIIKHFFATYDIKVLHHTSSMKNDVFNNKIFSPEFVDTIHSDDIYKRYFPLRGMKNSWACSRTYGQEFSMQVDMSSVCISRDILKTIKWKERYECEFYRGNSDGCGYEFSMESLYTYNKSLITGSPLTIVK